jgi:hypothetical protein
VKSWFEQCKGCRHLRVNTHPYTTIKCAARRVGRTYMYAASVLIAGLCRRKDKVRK